MRLESGHVIKWYSATLGVAAGAVLYAFAGFGPVLPGIVMFVAVSYYSLIAVCTTDVDASPYDKTSEYIAAAGIAAFLPLILLTHFLIALVVFLGFAQLALNFQTHDYRRFYVGIAVSFVGICVGATESKSGFYLFFFLAYTILAGLTIGYAYMAQRRDVEKPHWDLGDRTRVCLLLIGLAVGIYLILPRLPAGGLLAQPGSDHFYRDIQWEKEAQKNEKTNGPDLINAFMENQRKRQDKEAFEDLREEEFSGDGNNGGRDRTGDFDYRGFRKEFNINNPDETGHRFSNRIVARMRADRPQYLRARIFDQFDGLHWRCSSDQLVKLGVGFDGVTLIPADDPSSSKLQRYEIFLEHDLGDYIPAAAVPVKLDFPSTVIGVDIFGQLRSPGALKEGTAYAVTSQYNLRHGRLFAELDPSPLPSYTRLPPETDPRIKELADKVTHGAVSQLACAVALEDHLRTHYQYDLGSVINSQGTTPLSEFLFESRTGHCEYFASALAVMLRTQNIPSRLVTGFSATNRNPLTGYYDIYALDGHAWVEAFVDGQGWVILEPTAYYNGPLAKEEDLCAHQINDYVERQIRQRNALGLDELTPASIMNSVWHLLYMIVSAGLAYVQRFIINSRYWLIAVLSIGVGSWFAWRHYRYQWLAYRIYRKVAAYPGQQPRKAIKFYLSAIEDLLGLAGFQPPPGYTIERYLEHLQSIIDIEGNGVLAGAFNRVYYNNEGGEPQNMQHYKQLFRNIYSIPLRDLRLQAKKHCCSWKNTRTVV